MVKVDSSSQQNGNTQVNGMRDSFNSKVANLSMLGSTRRVEWDSKRRHRSI